jgi:hypothetical protein
MKIKMKTAMAGMNFSYRHGEVIEVTDAVGKAWIEADIAQGLEQPEAEPPKADTHKAKGKK